MTTSEGCYPSFPGPDTSGERGLTNPSEGVKNSGYDNVNSDLVMHVNDVLVGKESGRRYVVADFVGQGTFGQVVKCWSQETQSFVAVKVIKNQEAYYHQARVEVGILRLLNERYDTERHNIVRLLDFFRFRQHLCLVFELLGTNLYELLKRNGYRGLSLQLVRFFLKQMLDTLATLRDERIIHCDLKPENVLLRDQTTGRIKIIDFGSACLEHKTVYSYIQSRFYRSPEVVLGHPYTTAIDMWSLGCVAAELFLGLPLFPAASERDLLARLIEMLGPPPESVLRTAKHTKNYFKEVEVQVDGRRKMQYELLSQEEFEAKNNTQSPSGKRYFKHVKLANIIGAYPIKSGTSDADVPKEKENRECFVDFLLGILEVDPQARWTPHQAALHPFISGDPFKGPFQPPSAPDPRSHTNPVGIQDPRMPRGHSYSWHADAFHAHSATAAFLQSPAHARAHAQAHAFAMAAVQHLSPQMSPHFGSTQAPGSLGVLPATPDDNLLSHSFTVPVGDGADSTTPASQQQSQNSQQTAKLSGLSHQVPHLQLNMLQTGQGLSPRNFATSPSYMASISGSQMSPGYLDRIAAAAVAAAQETVRKQLDSLTGLGPKVSEPHRDKPLPPTHPAATGIPPELSHSIVGFQLPDKIDSSGKTERPTQSFSLRKNGNAAPVVLDTTQGGGCGELITGAVLSDDGGERFEVGDECPTARVHDEEDGTTVEEYSPSPGDWDPNYSDIEFLHSSERDLLEWEGEFRASHNAPVGMHDLMMPVPVSSVEGPTEVLDFEAMPKSPVPVVQNAALQPASNVFNGHAMLPSESEFQGSKSRSKRGQSSGAVLTTLPASGQNSWGSYQAQQRTRFATNEGLHFLTSTTTNRQSLGSSQGVNPLAVHAPQLHPTHSDWSLGAPASPLHDIAVNGEHRKLDGVNGASRLSGPGAEAPGWCKSLDLNAIVSGSLSYSSLEEQTSPYAAHAQTGLQASFVGTPTRYGMVHCQPTAVAEHCGSNWTNHQSTLSGSDHSPFPEEDCDASRPAASTGASSANQQGSWGRWHNGQQDWHHPDLPHVRYRANSDSLKMPTSLTASTGKSWSMDCGRGLQCAKGGGAVGYGPQANWAHPPPFLPHRGKAHTDNDTARGAVHGPSEATRAGHHREQSLVGKLGKRDFHHAGENGMREPSKAGIGQHSLSSLQVEQQMPGNNILDIGGQIDSWGFHGEVRESRTSASPVQPSSQW